MGNYCQGRQQRGLAPKWHQISTWGHLAFIAFTKGTYLPGYLCAGQIHGLMWKGNTSFIISDRDYLPSWAGTFPTVPEITVAQRTTCSLPSGS